MSPPSKAPPLSRLRLVLVGTRHPGNVGACARLAANYDVRDWVIAAPHCRWDDFDARKFATGSAGAFLSRLREVPGVREATADCVAAVGFTRRLGKSRRPSLAVSELAAFLRESRGRVAFVFGNEETGLTSEELEPCTHLCQLPTAAGHPSLNLSHAVAAALSRAYADLAPGPRASGKRGRAGRLAELEGMLAHWRELLVDIGLDQAGNPERLLARLRGVFERAALDQVEIRALRGLLSKAQVRLGTRRRGKRVVPDRAASGVAPALVAALLFAASPGARATDSTIGVGDDTPPAPEASPAPEVTTTPGPPLVGPELPQQPPPSPGLREEDLESYVGPNDVSAPYRLPPFRLGVNVQLVANGFDLTPSNEAYRDKQLTYRPAQSEYIGVIAGYKWLGGTVSFSLPSSQSTQAVEGTSQYQDYRLSYYSAHFGAEATFDRYEGFLIDNSSILSSSALNGAKYYKIPDLLSLGFGLNFFYVFRPDRFSLPAALDQTAVQGTSGGSGLLLATWREQWIQTESGQGMIPAEMQPYFGADGGLDKVRSRDLAAGTGYGYYWTRRDLFASVVGALTMGYQHTSYDAGDGGETNTSASFNLHLRGGLGINSRRFFLVASVYYDRFEEYTQTIEVGDDVYGVTIGTGVRF